MISGFTFVHNALNGGYPIVEAIYSVLGFVNEVVVVDMQSDDGTRALLDRMPIRVIDGEWGSNAGETLRAAHALNTECKHDTILHFEADEVFDQQVALKLATLHHEHNLQNALVWRLQLEQNFQRVRWYPTLVHRLFERGKAVKHGHSTEQHLVSGFEPKTFDIIPEKVGFLWDITNCFKDNWKGRIKQQTELWHGIEPAPKRVPLHFHFSIDVTEEEDWFSEPHWEFTNTPFKIPAILIAHVGQPKYIPQERYIKATEREIV